MSGRLNETMPTTTTSAASGVASASSANSALSPLKRFGRAKSKINSIYEEILAYGCEVAKFLNNFTEAQEAQRRKDEAVERDLHGVRVIPEDCVTRAETYKTQLEAISSVLKRNHMKVRPILHF